VEEKFDQFLLLDWAELPKIVQPIASEATLDQVNHLVATWQVFVARLMFLEVLPSEEYCADLDRHIKLFLSAVDKFDETRRNKEKKKAKKVPVWRTKPNYLGLLNIPDCIREMGPIRRLTELDNKGEASIKRVKAKIRNGQKGNFAYNAMAALYRETSFRYVLRDGVMDAKTFMNESLKKELKPGYDEMSSYMLEVGYERSLSIALNDGEDESGAVRNCKTAKRYKGCRPFVGSSGRTKAIESLLGDDIVSGLVLDDRLYFVIKSGNETVGQEIKAIKYRTQVCGADYISYGITGEGDTDLSNAKQDEFFLMLPMLDQNGKRSKGFFYLITSRWREMTHQGEECFSLQLPKIPGASY